MENEFIPCNSQGVRSLVTACGNSLSAATGWQLDRKEPGGGWPGSQPLLGLLTVGRVRGFVEMFLPAEVNDSCPRLASFFR